MEYRYQEAATTLRYAADSHEPPDIEAPEGWQAAEGVLGVWRPYAAAGTVVRWTRCLVKAPDEAPDPEEPGGEP